MKKKLLSLVLAGAMVASTSVSAFATETTHEIKADQEKEVEVKVEGNIAGHDGNVLPSSVTVTVPTTANFTVNKKGELSSPTMYIRNSGETAVLVIASEFIDSNGETGINVVKGETDISDKRKNITLKITGGDRDFILTSEQEGNKYGKIYDADGNPISSEANRVIGKATKDNPLELTLSGKGIASKESDQAIQDNFKLKLKIKQERQ